jgi:hypothetical protein
MLHTNISVITIILQRWGEVLGALKSIAGLCALSCPSQQFLFYNENMDSYPPITFSKFTAVARIITRWPLTGFVHKGKLLVASYSSLGLAMYDTRGLLDLDDEEERDIVSESLSMTLSELLLSASASKKWDSSLAASGEVDLGNAIVVTDGTNALAFTLKS